MFCLKKQHLSLIAPKNSCRLSQNQVEYILGKIMKHKGTFVVIVLWVIALCGGAVTMDHLPWYNLLNKPSFTPPNYIFGIVWPLLYTLIAFSAILILRKGPDTRKKKQALTLFILQYIFNILWGPLTFGCESVSLGLYWILILDFLSVVTLLLFTRLHILSGILFLPYIIWLFFATILMQSIWSLNTL